MRRRLVREGVAVTELGALIYSALDHNLKKVGCHQAQTFPYSLTRLSLFAVQTYSISSSDICVDPEHFLPQFQW
jgi:hypothetical protein